MRWNTILFDLDGTLSDPAEGICTSVQYALQRGGYRAGPKEDFFKWIGPPLHRSFEVYAGVDEEEAARLLRLYRERYNEIGLFENVMYPGIDTMLRRLKEQGARVAVATGKPEPTSIRVLEHFGLLPYVDTVCGTSFTDHTLEKCELIQRAFHRLGIEDTSRAVMVGDRSHDAIGAKMAHVDFIGVLYGYGEREELEFEGCTLFAESVEELTKLLLD